MLGTIVSFDASDAVGWVKLEDGNTACFDKDACLDLDPIPTARVYVSAVRASVGGLIVAERLEPHVRTLQETRPVTAAFQNFLASLEPEEDEPEA
jgi:hypothetical protein